MTPPIQDHSFPNPLKGIQPLDAAVLLPALLMALAFEIFGESFGKRGFAIPLPSGLGSIPNFQAKLFPMEIFLGWVGLITLARVKHWLLPRKGDYLFWGACILLVFGLLRAFLDLRANPLLVVRNAAFVWYLSLPLFIALIPLASERWEQGLRIFYGLVFTYSAYSVINSYARLNTELIFWCADVGFMLPLAYGLCGRRGWAPHAALLGIGLVFGLALFSKMQRTVLLGTIITVAALLVAPWLPRRMALPRPQWRRLLWIPFGLALSYGVGKLEEPYDRAFNRSGMPANPFVKGETNSSGLENFRLFLWKDAVAEFLEAPILGIGFARPVVYRVYNGGGKFLENSGSFEFIHKATPPISGPHNSYLNALARLGIWGLGFLLLHLACAWQLFRKKYWACLWILVAQMLYAFFNVGLEGPLRSICLLFIIGAAMKSAREESRTTVLL